MPPIKSYIIQSKNYNLALKSSSGGMFAELAKYVLSQSGIVFGCAMERTSDGFDVKHIFIEDEKDLYKLQGSKYVQSNLGDSIKQAKEFLDKGKLVLFSGTPCQIAGLKTYLKQDYQNLLTVDLSCEGTPSLKLFNDYIKYLEENVVKAKIIDFKFRSKKHFGWGHTGFVAIYEDNNQQKELLISKTDSSYYNIFLNCYTLQERCFSCKYTGINRQSDITIADAWGVETEYPDLLKKKFNKNKGISLVLVNSSKGSDIFQSVKNNLIFNEVDVKRLRKYNHPLRHPSVRTKKADAYLEAYKQFGYKGIEDLFNKNKTVQKTSKFEIIKKYTPEFIKVIIRNLFYKNTYTDCLLYTMFSYPNYGSLLTAYALQKAVEDLGYNNKIIYNNDIFGFNKSFAKKWLKLTKRVGTIWEFKNLNYVTNTFICGSDNLLNLNDSSIRNLAFALLNFTDNDKKRLLISGSIGSWDGIAHDETEQEYIKYLLKRFDYLSTRENHGKEVFEKVFDVKADWINDPVLYLDKQDYLYMIKDVKQNYHNKIMSYILYPTEKTTAINEYFKNKLNKEIIEFKANAQNVDYFTNFKNKSTEDWLSAIINSDLIITDSFHCIVFSLMFNKPFVCIKNSHNTVRFLSFFNRLGINIPLIENVEEIENTVFDYNKELVNSKLKEIREFALEKLEENLLKPKTENEKNEKMDIYNKKFITPIIPWYQKNKIFYYIIIRRFVSPLKKMINNIKSASRRK